MVKSIIHVNPVTGKDSDTGDTVPFKTLTKALSMATAGTTIHLAAGTYNAARVEVFPLVIPKVVMVVGNKPTKGKDIVISGSGNYVSPTFNRQNITIRDSAAPLIADNKILGNPAGIVLMRQVQPVLRRNLIENNTHGALVVNGRARPDNGNSQDPAGNILRNNGKADIQNSSCVRLVSLGNQLNRSRIEGPVELRSSQVPVRQTGSF
ncbi:DUF1565 domain-containing protein [Moorena producens]|uniref:DUF1565 domain-containing protein n=1 Tax=Moorena producens TaxID=1155739 RepID=UPI003C74852D